MSTIIESDGEIIEEHGNKAILSKKQKKQSMKHWGKFNSDEAGHDYSKKSQSV